MSNKLQNEEIEVLKFMVGDLVPIIGNMPFSSDGADDYTQFAPFDIIYQMEDIDYASAIDYAQSYCTFCSDLKVLQCRKLAYEMVHYSAPVKSVAQIVSSAVKPDFVDTVKRFIKGVYFYSFETDDKGTQQKVYSNNLGGSVNESELRRNRVEISSDNATKIMSYYKIFADKSLWLKLTKSEMLNNASVMLSGISSFVEMMRSVIRVEEKYHLGQKINEGRAVVAGLRCNFDTNDVQVGIAERGGKITYISSRRTEDICLIGDDRFKDKVISAKEVSELEALGLDPDSIQCVIDGEEENSYVSPSNEQFKNIGGEDDVCSNQPHGKPSYENQTDYPPESETETNESGFVVDSTDVYPNNIDAGEDENPDDF